MYSPHQGVSIFCIPSKRPKVSKMKIASLCSPQMILDVLWTKTSQHNLCISIVSNWEHAVLAFKMWEEHFPEISYIRETFLSEQKVGESCAHAPLFFFFSAQFPISIRHSPWLWQGASCDCAKEFSISLFRTYSCILGTINKKPQYQRDRNTCLSCSQELAVWCCEWELRFTPT